jgi:hypothetical protein
VGSPPAAGATSRLQVEQGRCAAVYKAADAALSCAIAFLLSGDPQAFAARLAAPQH